MSRESFKKKWDEFIEYKSTKDHHISICHRKGDVWDILISGKSFEGKKFNKRKEALDYVKDNYPNSFIYLHNEDGSVIKRIET